MSKNKKNRKKGGAALGPLIGLLFGGMLGVFGGEAVDRLAGGNDGLAFLYLLLGLIGLYLGIVVQIIVHEGGHLVFGLRSGYRFVSFNILGWIWQRDDKGQLRAGRMQLPGGAAGQCLMAPPAWNGGDFPFVAYNLGGVVANVVWSALCALGAWGIPLPAVQILLVMQALVGVFLALTNGLPLTLGGNQNDGKNILCIRKDLEARRAFWVQMAIAAALAQGVRLKDMDESWFAPFPEEKLDNPIIAAIAVLNTSRRMDQLDLAGAEAEIRTLMARETGILGVYRMTMGCDGAVCELIAGRPADLTEGLSAKETRQMLKAMKSHPAVLRTQYALALLKDRDEAAAQKLLDAFEKAATKHPNPQEIVGERELLDLIRRAASAK